MSLWEIDGSQAADFVEEFYRLYRSGMDKSGVLTQAKRNMIRRGTKYEVWVPFVLIGDPR